MFALAITGYSGVGKTTALRQAADHGFLTSSVGEVVRQEYAEQSHSESLAAFNTRIHRDDPAYFVRQAFDNIISRLNSEHPGVAIDGVHSPVSIGVLRNRFNSVQVIYVDAPVSDRLRRLRDREGDVTARGLLNRDLRESRYGLIELARPNRHDVHIRNDTDLNTFHETVSRVVATVKSDNQSSVGGRERSQL